MTRIVPARTFAAVIVLAGIAAALSAAYKRYSTNELLVQDGMRHAADAAATSLTAKLKLYEYGLRGARAAIIGAGGERISAERFRAYIRSRDLPTEFPGALGFGLVRRVPREAEAAYVAAQRRDAAPDFTVHGLSEHAGERFVIELVEPPADNVGALGLDLASETSRRDAAMRAMQTGTAAITGPIQLVQVAHGLRTGFLLFLPVLREGARASDAREREEATVAWAYGVVSLARVLATFELDETKLAMALDDVSAAGASQRMVDSPGLRDDTPYRVRRAISIFGRTWELELRARPAFLATLRLGRPLVEGAEVLGVALLLAFASYLYLSRIDHARKHAELQQRELEERVTERTEEVRRASDRLEVLTVQLQTAQRIANIGSWELDVLTGKVIWSDELHRVFGVDPAEGVPDSAGQAALFSQESWADLTAATAKSVATGQGYEVETTILRRDGEERHAVARAEALRAPSGEVVRLVGTLQDVTARERTAMEMREMSERLKLATSAAEIGVWEVDANTGLSKWDETTRRIYGQPVGVEQDPERIGKVVHPDDVASVAVAIDRTLKSGTPFDEKFRVVRPSGEVRHVHAQGTLQDDAHGRPTRVVGVSRDVTDAHLLETALRSSEATLRTMLANAGSAIIATRGGVVALFNRAAEELLGYGASEVIGKLSPRIFHDPAELEQRRVALSEELGQEVSVTEVLTRPAREGKTDTREWIYVRKDGTHVPVLLTLTSIRDADGAMSGYLGVAVDLTLQKEHQRALQDLNQLLAQRTEQAESASRAKSMFLANMSHEIRTPIGAITGLTYLLMRTTLSDEQRGLLDSVERSTKALLSMVNDVLDLSKIEAQQLELESAPFVLAEVLDDVSSFMHAYATRKPLALSLDAEQVDLRAVLMGDRVRLMQVLTNLVGNAIKYTDAGSVRLRVREQSLPAAPAIMQIVFEVEDTGPGMAPDFMPHLFTAFTQAEVPGERRREGTGLGLAIVKQLVTLMGGEVGADSVLGQGSRFWASIRFQRAADDAPRAHRRSSLREGATDQRLSGVRILVADDSDINRDIAHAILELEGAHVRLACDGAEAVEMVCASAGEIDLVLMDVQMPVLDGVAATERIRADARFGALPILAVTAGALATERERALAAGMDDFVTKPYEPEALIERVREWIRDGRGASVASR